MSAPVASALGSANPMRQAITGPNDNHRLGRNRADAETASRIPENTLTRRKMLQSLAFTSSAAIGAVILPSQPSVAFGEHVQASQGLFDYAADSHPARELIDELIAAISAETEAFSTAPHDDEGQVITDAGMARVMVAKDALLAIPKRELLEDSRMATEVTLALLFSTPLAGHGRGLSMRTSSG